jgi:hypothetical protein
MRSSRLIVAVVAVGAALLWASFTPSSWFGSGRSPTGYYFRFAAQAGPPLPGEGGGATVYVATNLPDQTLVVVRGGTVQRFGNLGGWVEQGAVRISVGNGHCFNAFEPQELTFGVSIATGPVIDDALYNEVSGTEGIALECFRAEGCDRPQPPSVVAELGKHFERLTGPQVHTVDGVPVILARSHAYSWPRDTCAPELTQTRLDTCPDQRSILALTTGQLEWYPAQVLTMANQWKPCMVWASGSEAFRSEHPWPTFRDDFTHWLEAVSRVPVVAPERLRVTWSSTERFPLKRTTLPERFEVEYTKGPRTIARASFAHDSDRYELTGLELSLASG